MSAQNITDKKLFTTNEIVKGLVFAFLFGGAWVRFEYSVDRISDKQEILMQQQQTILEKYIITNDYDKKILNMRIEQLENRLKTQTDGNFKEVDNTFFVKPDELKIKNS